MSLTLYVKVWCPWCVRAQAWLDARGYLYQLIDVEKPSTNLAMMVKVSGQSRAPTLVIESTPRAVLADFGPEEIEAFLSKHQITP